MGFCVFCLNLTKRLLSIPDKVLLFSKRLHLKKDFRLTLGKRNWKKISKKTCYSALWGST